MSLRPKSSMRFFTSRIVKNFCHRFWVFRVYFVWPTLFKNKSHIKQYISMFLLDFADFNFFLALFFSNSSLIRVSKSFLNYIFSLWNCAWLHLNSFLSLKSVSLNSSRVCWSTKTHSFSFGTLTRGNFVFNILLHSSCKM